MGDVNKKYIIEVLASQKSLNKFKEDVKTSFKDAFSSSGDEGRIKPLTNQEKATMASNAEAIMGITEHEAKAFLDAIQGAIPKTQKELNTMRSNLRQMLELASGIVQEMQKTGNVTDWTKQGIDVVGQFSKMIELTKKIPGLDSSIALLNGQIERFNSTATSPYREPSIVKGLTDEAKELIDQVSIAQQKIDELKRARSTKIKSIANDTYQHDSKKSGWSIEDSAEFTADQVKEKYQEISDTIRTTLQQISDIESEFVGRKTDMYVDDKYQNLLTSLQKSLATARLLENHSLFGTAFEGLDDNLNATLRRVTSEITDSVSTAGKKIQDIIEGITGKGIELAITIQDAESDEFASKIDSFVREASKKFSEHPIEVAVDIVSPFNNDAYDEEGNLKALTDKQREISDKIITTFKNKAAKSGIEVSEEDLTGLYHKNVHKTTRNVLDAFNAMHGAMTSGQNLLATAAKSWRAQMEEEFAVTPKFNTEKTKEDIRAAISDIQNEFDKTGDDDSNSFWITARPDTRGFIDELQDALKDKSVTVNVKAGEIDASGTPIDLSRVKIIGDVPPSSDGSSGSDSGTVANGGGTSPLIVQSQEQTASMHANSEVVEESTRVQKILNESIRRLDSRIQANDQRIEQIKDREGDGDPDQIIERTTQAIAEIEASRAKLDSRRREIAGLLDSETDTTKVGSLRAELQDIERSLATQWKYYESLLNKLQTAQDKKDGKVTKQEEDKKTSASKKYEDENKTLKKERNAIAKVLENNDNPVKLVASELKAFWTRLIGDMEKAQEAGDVEKLNRLQLKATAMTLKGLDITGRNDQEYQDKMTAIWKKLDASSKSAFLDALNKSEAAKGEAYKEISGFKDDKIYGIVQSAYQEKESALRELATSNPQLKQILSTIEHSISSIGIVDDETVIAIVERAMRNDKALGAHLTEDRRLKSAYVDRMGYYVPQVQKAMGIIPQTSEAAEREMNLAESLKSALKLNEYIKRARALLKDVDKDIDPGDIQKFIDYFGHFPEMADSIEYAKKYLAEMQSVSGEPWKNKDQKTYQEQFSNLWGTLDANSKKQFIGALNKSDAVNGKVLSEDSDLSDKKWYGIIRDAYQEEGSALRELTSNNPQLSAILSILQRSALLSNTRMSSRVFESDGRDGRRAGLLSSLHGLQRDAGTMHVTVVGRDGQEKVLELNGGRNATEADKRFTYAPKSLERFARRSGKEKELGELVDAMFDPLLLTRDRLEAEVSVMERNINSLKLGHPHADAFNGTNLEENFQSLMEAARFKQSMLDYLDPEDSQIDERMYSKFSYLRAEAGLRKSLKNIEQGHIPQYLEEKIADLTPAEREEAINAEKTKKQTELDEYHARNREKILKELANNENALKEFRNKHRDAILELIKVEEQALEAKRKELEAARQAAIPAEKNVEEKSRALFTEQFRLSSGRDAAKPLWAQDEQFSKTTLGQYNEKEKSLRDTIEIYKSGKVTQLLQNRMNWFGEAEEVARQKIIEGLESQLAEHLANPPSKEEILKSLLVREGDILRANARASRAGQQARANQRVADRISSEDDTLTYEGVQRKYMNTTRRYDPKLTGLLAQMDFAGQHGIMDVGELNKLADVFRAKLEAYEPIKQLVEDAKASVGEDNIDPELKEKYSNAFKEMDRARTELIDKFFNTKGWNVSRVLQESFVSLDNELAVEERQIRENAENNNSTISAEVEKIKAQEAETKAEADRYVESLIDTYILKPLRDADFEKLEYSAEKSAIAKDAQAKRDALQRRVQDSSYLKSQIAEIESERSKNFDLNLIKTRRSKVAGIDKAVQLMDGSIKEVIDRADSDEAIKQLKEMILQLATKRKSLEDSGKSDTDEYKKLTQELSAARDKLFDAKNPYVQEINDIINSVKSDFTEDQLEYWKYIKEQFAYRLHGKDTGIEHSVLREQRDKLASELEGAEAKEAGINSVYDARIAAVRQLIESDKVIHDKVEAIKSDWSAETGPIEQELANLRGQDGGLSSDRYKELIAQRNAINVKYNQAIRDAQAQWIAEQSAAIEVAEQNALANLIQGSGVDSGELLAQFNQVASAKLGREVTVTNSDEIRAVVQEIKEKAYADAEAAALQAMRSIDRTGEVTQEDIDKQIAEARAETEATKASNVALLKTQTDADVMAAYRAKAAETLEASETASRDHARQLRAAQNADIERYHITAEMLDAARENAAMSGELTAAKKAERKAVEEASLPRTSEQKPYAHSGGGAGAAGGGYIGAIDTSRLATEATLRSIYLLLNGAPPEGGWSSNGNADVVRSSGVVEGEDIVTNLKRLLSRLSIPTEEEVETQAFADRLGRLLHVDWSENNRVSMATWASALNKALQSGTPAMDFHTHQNRDWAPSEVDLHTFLDRAYGMGKFAVYDPIKIQGSIAQGSGTGVAIDYSGIDQQVALKIRDRCIELYHELVNNNPDLFAFDGDGRLALYDTTVENRDLLNVASQKMFEAISRAFTEFGYADAVLKLTPDSVGKLAPKLQQATAKVADAVVDSGAKAAIESSEQINPDLYGFDPKDKGILNTLRRTKSGNNLTNAQIVERYLKDGFTPKYDLFGHTQWLENGSGDRIDIGVSQLRYAEYLQDYFKAFPPKTAQQVVAEVPVEPVPTQTAEQAVQQTVPTDPVDVPVEPVVKADAQAAVDSTKKITMPEGQVDDTTVKKLSEQIKAVRGKQDGGTLLYQSMSDMYHLGITSDDYKFDASHTDKLAISYSKLVAGMEGTIASQLDDGVKAYIEMLRAKLLEIAKNNNLDYAKINKDIDARKANAKNIDGTSLTKESYDKTIQYLASKKDETGAGRAKEGLKRVYDVLSSGKETLSDGDIKNLGSGYFRLVETMGHEIFEKLDADTQQILKDAASKALHVLKDAGAYVYGSMELQGATVSDKNKRLINRQGTGPSGGIGQKFTNIIEPAIEVTRKNKDGQEETIVLQKAVGQFRAINEEKKKQNQLTSEGVKRESEAATVVEQHAQSAKKITEAYNTSLTKESVAGVKSKLDTFTTTKDDGTETKQAGVSRAKYGITNVSKVLLSGDETLSGEQLDTLKKGYGQLVGTIEHEIFKKLDAETQEILIRAKNEALKVLNKYGVDISSSGQSATSGGQSTGGTSSGGMHGGSSSGGASGGGTSGGSNQGGFLGALNRIAQEPTLQKILALLSGGIKMDSDEKESGGAKDRGATDDGDKNITSSDAYAIISKYIGEKYPSIALNPDKIKSSKSGYSADISLPKNRDLKEARDLQEQINQYIANGEANTQDCIDAQARLNALLKEQEIITISVSANGEDITEKSSFNNLAIGAKAAIKELQTVEGMMSRLHENGAISVGADGNVSSSNATITNYINSLKELQQYKSGLTSEELFDPSVQQRLSTLTLATQGYRKEVEQLLRAHEQYNTGEKIGVLSGDLGDDYGAIKNAMQGMVSETSKYKATFGELTPVIKNGQVVSYQLAYSLQTGKRQVQEMTAALDPLTGELRIQKGAVKEVATGWDKFVSGLKGKFASITQYIFSMGSIHRVFSTFRQGIQHVRNIDLALTELKKVTDETTTSYNRFLQTASKTAGEIGSTVADFVNATADFARLGYNIQQAHDLAKAASVYKNVGDGINDISAASESIISTMKAFGIEANDAMGIVDRFNEVGEFIAQII